MLPQGSVLALKAAGLRIPEGTPDAHRELADQALHRIVDVMNERVSSFHAHSVLTAARGIREEICGKVTDKLEHSGEVAFALVDPFARPPG